jgi:hypothetical protein
MMSQFTAYEFNDRRRPSVIAQNEIRTQFLKVDQTSIHTPPQLRPLRKLVLRARLQ